MSLSIAILVSGRGSNMKAILEAIASGSLAAHVAVVISNNPEAPALKTAAEFEVATCVIASKGLSRSQHEQAVVAELSKYAVDFVVLAGYMRILTADFLRHFRHADGWFKVINIHPSLLPQFPGAQAYEDAFTAGVSESGITVHLVDELVDHGPILAQEKFRREDDDTLERFKARGLALEHKLFPCVLQSIARDGLIIKEGQMISPATASGSAQKGSDAK